MKSVKDAKFGRVPSANQMTLMKQLNTIIFEIRLKVFVLPNRKDQGNINNQFNVISQLIYDKS